MLRFLCPILLLLVVETTGNALSQVASGERRSSLKAVIDIPANMTIPAVIVFGDSIVDTGNNNNLLTVVKCNFPPYGQDFPGGVATGRFSDGKVPSDLVAEMLGVAKTLPPYIGTDLKPENLLQGVTFASGGSGFDPLTAKATSVVSIWDQLNYFKEYIAKIKQITGEKRANFILENSLFLVVSSSNDISISYLARALQYNSTSYTNFLADLASDFVTKLYRLGARRIGIFSAVPVGCVPAQRTLGGGVTRKCAEDLNELATRFNSKVSPMFDSLQRQLPDSRIVLIEVYDTLLDMIQNPKNYGFEVADKGCCGTGYVEGSFLCNKLTPLTCSDTSAYLFWDSYHPTERAYRIIVEKMLNKYISRFV